MSSKLIHMSRTSQDELSTIAARLEKELWRAEMVGKNSRGSGGGEGIFNISWGANSEFADDAADILRGMGFQKE